MRHHKSRSPNKGVLIRAAVMAVGVAVASGLLFMAHGVPKEKDKIIANAESGIKEYKWTKKAVEKGTTVNADYLWPDEPNAAFTAVYRDGERLPDDKMVTVTEGSVYHFRGISDESVLYTEVYVGLLPEVDVTKGESGTWYGLLPSAVRKIFEEKGWVWQKGWEYTDKAYLDKGSRRVMIKDSDPTAVLYGIGLYLDDEYGYSKSSAFNDEGPVFTDVFGETENLFASALEYFYTKGGELRSTCPKIYAEVAGMVSKFDGSAPIAESTALPIKTPKPVLSENPYLGPTSGTGSIQDTADSPIPVAGLLDYVNSQRMQAGLNEVSWDSANDDNICIRMQEVMTLFSQNRPDGSDAFTAYAGMVMSEIRIMDAYTVEDIFASASSYFLMDRLESFNCVVYGNIALLIFTW